MTIGRLYMQLERENINFRIKRSSIILVNQRSELKSCLALSFKTATQSGQEFSLKNHQFTTGARLYWPAVDSALWHEKEAIFTLWLEGCKVLNQNLETKK